MLRSARSAIDHVWQGRSDFALGRLGPWFTARERRDAGRHRHGLTRAGQCLAMLAGATVVLPVVYSAILVDQWDPFALPWKYHTQLVLTLACNLLLILLSFIARGRIERKLRRLLASAMILHPVVSMAVITAGVPHRCALLLSGVSMSIVCGLAAVFVSSRARNRRVGAIACGLSPEIERWLGPMVDTVRDFSADLRQYEVVLVDFNEGFAGPWIKSVSRAVLGGVEVAHIAEYLERWRGRVSPEHFELDHVNAATITGPYSVIKRLGDVALVLLAAPVVLPIAAIAGLAVALDLGRPVLFVQDRVGRGGTIFRMYKFRTMRERLPGEPARATARNDDRITPLGGILRRYRLDELPQLWNVLKGQMSLIGPRPEQPELAREYAKQIPAFSYRHLVRPGITGWAQVCFGYAENSQETREKLTYDLHYIKEFGFAIDLQVAIMTPGVILSGASSR
jgi:lipopolysaccharide/colanic/teichoic acid biosynthesis glycosyltransferase